MRKRLTASMVALSVALSFVLGASANADVETASFVVTVVASGAPVVAKVTANGKLEQHAIAQGKKHDFDFSGDVSKYSFDIIGCGKVQSKTLYVDAGHPGAKITVLASCYISIAGR